MTDPDRQIASWPGLWAVFLACSWTWCIGMYLPVILVREMGVWGWLIFAAPNVIGAAAMGWVLHDAAASRRFVERHRRACIGFSLITLLFHLYFAGWMIHALLGWALAAGTVLLAAGIWLVGRRRQRLDLAAGVVVLAFSLGAFAWAGGTYEWPAATGELRLPALAAAWLAPACLFGFLLCPYLDLTFHRARQATTPAGGRFAFGIGFGVLFLSMIVFSLWYAPWLAEWVRGPSPLPSPGVTAEGVAAAAGAGLLPVIIGLHMLIQTAFTVAVHLRELPDARFAGPSRAASVTAGTVGVLLAVLAVPFIVGPGSGEMIYLMFMGFYGLAFPAYVWLCAVPGRGWRVPGASRRNLAVLLTCVLMAAPMFWMGFILMQTIWLVPGVGIVLAGRLFVRTDDLEEQWSD